jgi:hypothetical protein
MGQVYYALHSTNALVPAEATLGFDLAVASVGLIVAAIARVYGFLNLRLLRRGRITPMSRREWCVLAPIAAVAFVVIFTNLWRLHAL